MRIIFKTFSNFSSAIMKTFLFLNFTPSWILFPWVFWSFFIFWIQEKIKGVDFWFFFWQLKVGFWIKSWRKNKHSKELYHYDIQFLALFFHFLSIVFSYIFPCHLFSSHKSLCSLHVHKWMSPFLCHLCWTCYVSLSENVIWVESRFFVNFLM